MQVATFKLRSSARLSAIVLAGFLGAVALTPVAQAADGPVLVDPSLIASLQLRARQAAPREQVQMYADLADKISLLVGKQLSDGDEDKAQTTLRLFESCAAELETGLQHNSKNLKRTEVLLHATHRRLSDMVRSAPGDIKPLVQSAVTRLDRVQTTLLSAVFEH